MIQYLLFRNSSGSRELRDHLKVSPGGIAGRAACSVVRQVLILPASTRNEFGLSPGMLMEDVGISVPYDFHALPSGSVVQAGTVRIRLTYHCEPCKMIRNFVTPRKALHKRGYLGSFLDEGKICIGDTLKLLDEHFEEIPYSIPARVEWYLARCKEPVAISKLVHDIGLPKGYCRAMPSLLRRFPNLDASKVIYKSQQSWLQSEVL